MIEQLLKVAIKAALPQGLKIKFDQEKGQVLLLTSKDELMKQLSFLEAEQLINSHLGGVIT